MECAVGFIMNIYIYTVLEVGWTGPTMYMEAIQFLVQGTESAVIPVFIPNLGKLWFMPRGG